MTRLETLQSMPTLNDAEYAELFLLLTGINLITGEAGTDQIDDDEFELSL